MSAIRILVPSDEPALERFLAAHADSALILRSNIKAAGLVDSGQPRGATYAGAMEGDRVMSVAAHCWNGVVLLQGPTALKEVVHLAVARSGRVVTGFMGPRSETAAARRALGIDDAPTSLDSCDVLMALDLDDLRQPDPAASAEMVWRPTRDDEVELFTEWRVAFTRATGIRSDGPDLEEHCRREVVMFHEASECRLLEYRARPVACLIFNARLTDQVLIGGVWTPPEYRGRGFARTLTAGCLMQERAKGVRRAVLCADPANQSARAAYEAVGFREVGNFGLIMFTAPWGGGA
jgi:uncharacterized protein